LTDFIGGAKYEEKILGAKTQQINVFQIQGGQMPPPPNEVHDV